MKQSKQRDKDAPSSWCKKHETLEMRNADTGNVIHCGWAGACRDAVIKYNKWYHVVKLPREEIIKLIDELKGGE